MPVAITTTSAALTPGASAAWEGKGGENGGPPPARTTAIGSGSRLGGRHPGGAFPAWAERVCLSHAHRPRRSGRHVEAARGPGRGGERHPDPGYRRRGHREVPKGPREVPPLLNVPLRARG